MTALDRGKLLFKIADLIRANAADLAETDTANMGEPIVEAEFDVSDASAKVRKSEIGWYLDGTGGVTRPVPTRQKSGAK